MVGIGERSPRLVDLPYLSCDTERCSDYCDQGRLDATLRGFGEPRSNSACLT